MLNKIIDFLDTHPRFKPTNRLGTESFFSSTQLADFAKQCLQEDKVLVTLSTKNGKLICWGVYERLRIDIRHDLKIKFPGKLRFAFDVNRLHVVLKS